MPGGASEIDRLDPQPLIIKLSTGLQLEIVRLKTRQFFRLLKVLTHGAGNALLQKSLDFSADPEKFLQHLVSIVLISIPDAEQETIDFVRSMARPAGLPDKHPRLYSKAEREAAEAAWAELEAELYNPELEDLIDLVEAIIRQEASDIQALGKRIASLVELAGKTGQIQPESPEETPEPQELNASPEPTAPSSTSSPASTGGQISESSTSPSAGSGKSPRRSAKGSSPSTSPAAA